MSDQLAHDHAELDKLLGTLQVALDQGEPEQIHRSLDLFWARLAVHIRAEHLGLFPAVVRALEGQPQNISEAPSSTDAQTLIAKLRADHDFFMKHLARAIASVRSSLTADESFRAAELPKVKARIIAVVDRLVNHNKLEEQGIYLWVALLSQQEQSDLSLRLQKELSTMPHRFVQSDLRDYLPLSCE